MIDWAKQQFNCVIEIVIVFLMNIPTEDIN